MQEALTNALRHAGPARARVLVRYEPDAIELRIADNGIGDGRPEGGGGPGAADAGGGQGLIGMRERVALLGGELRAGPRPEGGFTVEARIPLDGEAR